MLWMIDGSRGRLHGVRCTQRRRDLIMRYYAAGRQRYAQPCYSFQRSFFVVHHAGWRRPAIQYVVLLRWFIPRLLFAVRSLRVPDLSATVIHAHCIYINQPRPVRFLC